MYFLFKSKVYEISKEGIYLLKTLYRIYPFYNTFAAAIKKHKTFPYQPLTNNTDAEITLISKLMLRQTKIEKYLNPLYFHVQSFLEFGFE